MGTEDLSLEEPLASEIAAVLRELARLSQRAGASEVDTRFGNTVAATMLEHLLELFAAQRGAILLAMQEDVVPEQHTFLAPLQAQAIRPLALHELREEEAYTLLPAFASPGTQGSEVSCWLVDRLALGEFTGEPELAHAYLPASSPALNRQGSSPTQASQSLQALLVLGWDVLADGTCSSAVERGRTLLPFISDAAGAVIIHLLLAERMQEVELTAAREALQHMELLKAELLATVSHELRSPLASIKGYAATLLRHERRLARAERHQFLLAISEASDRLERSIERLLEMSQLETGAITLERSPVDVALLAQEAITAAEQGLAAQAAGHFSFKLHLEHADGTPATSVPLLTADPRRLREVLDNLLENAIKYSPGGGTVTVLVRPTMQAGHPHPRILELCVSDTGMGIPAGHLERIFEQFYRVDLRLTREVSGLGLGLAICKRLIELHEGTIWAESALQHGSTLHVLLPIEEMDHV